jgi:uncharacterized protein (UPF0333 family)
MFLGNKGQISAELLFVTLIFLIIMGSLISLVSSEMDKTQTGELGKARILGEKIAETLNMVYQNGNGHSIILNLPNDFDFTAYVNNSGYVTVNYKGQVLNVKFIPKDIQAVTMQPNQIYKVLNDNGTIKFSLL